MTMVDAYLTFEPSFWELQDNTLFESSDRLDSLKKYVTSRFWFTYRRGFAPIGGTGPETDQGWGCMLRCAQMLLGEVLLRRHIGRDFEWTEGVAPAGNYERILRMFLDEKTALFSIHQIAQMGVSEGKSVGEWFGPNTAAQVIKKLAVFDSWSGIAVHVALDNILVSSDVHTIATLAPPKDAIKLIMGKPYDYPHGVLPNSLLTTYFKLDSCVGIIGGRPNHALYFIGISGDRLIYLDPHYCRPSVLEKYANAKLEDGFSMVVECLLTISVQTEDAVNDEGLDDTSFHCRMLLHMGYDQIDPSMAIAFFCETADAFNKLSADLKEKHSILFPASRPPLFEQMETRPKYWPPFEPYTGVKAKIEMKDADVAKVGRVEQREML
ncbi:unnamed protein product [Heligmosomoides polygyrus]|uniref:Cysteine protease n=1 Tax=Heligmosomoides polygyrus TaxID=6339 RepID=A0A3P7XBS4_HELPZ|nr:unnamed protein product [Heligmosomoides polygyrus]